MVWLHMASLTDEQAQSTVDLTDEQSQLVTLTDENSNNSGTQQIDDVDYGPRIRYNEPGYTYNDIRITYNGGET